MAQHYSNPKHADDAHALPDVETFYLDASDFLNAADATWMFEAMRQAAEDEVAKHRSITDDDIDAAVKARATALVGWYYWYCFPGCLPDSMPTGPFATEADALADARENAGVDDDDTE